MVYKDYKDWVSMAQDIRNGRLDAAVHDQPIIAATIKDHPDWNLELVPGYQPHQLRIRPATAVTHSARVTTAPHRLLGGDRVDGRLRRGQQDPVEWGLSGYNN